VSDAAGSPHRVLDVELRRVRLPLVAAHTAAHGSFSERDTIVVRVASADGSVGWGECAALARPTYTSEYLDGCWAVLVAELVPGCLAGDDRGVVGHHMAKAGLEAAVLDAQARAAGVPLTSLLGIAPTGEPARVLSTAVVGLAGSIDELLATVAARVAAGHRSVKVKIRPGWDAAPLRAVRAAWPHLLLAADANGSYRDQRHALEALRDDAAVADVDLVYVEQPLPADDLRGASHLVGKLGVPVALDESISSLGDLRTAVSLGAIEALNLKAARVGGLRAAARLAQFAETVGLPVLCGGMVETGIGRAASLAVAALPGCTLPTDLGPSGNYFVEDLTDPFVLGADGCLAVPTGPGIGVEPDLGRLEDATVEHWRATS